MNFFNGTILLYIDRGEKVEAEQTIEGDFEDIVEKDMAKINHTRTIEFKGTGENLKLDIQRIRYNKTYNETIYKYSMEQ